MLKVLDFKQQDEAMKIREGAELYAQQVLTSLENNLTNCSKLLKRSNFYGTVEK